MRFIGERTKSHTGSALRQIWSTFAGAALIVSHADHAEAVIRLASRAPVGPSVQHPDLHPRLPDARSGRVRVSSCFSGTHDRARLLGVCSPSAHYFGGSRYGLAAKTGQRYSLTLAQLKPRSARGAAENVLRHVRERAWRWRCRNAPALPSAWRPSSRCAFHRCQAWIMSGQISRVANTPLVPASAAKRTASSSSVSSEPAWMSVGGKP